MSWIYTSKGYGENKMTYIQLLIQLVSVLGPKIKEVLPLILQIIELFRDVKLPTGVSYAMPASPTPDYQRFITEALNNGADEQDAHKLAQLM